MYKHKRYVIFGICILSALVGIGAGYVIAGTLQASAMASRAEYGNYFATEIEPAIPEPEAYASEPEHRYLVTAQDGYIVVYNMNNPGQDAREVTTTTINALDREEQERLIEGIRIYSEEALVRILEDYGS